MEALGSATDATHRRGGVLGNGSQSLEIGSHQGLRCVQDDLPQEGLKGTVDVRGDIVGPALPESDWEALETP